MISKRCKWLPVLPTVLGALALGLPARTSGQYVTPGAARVEMSDVTVPAVGSLLLFENGTVKTWSCPVAYAVRAAADSVATGLAASELWVALGRQSFKVTRPVVMQRLLGVMSSRRQDEQAERTLRATFGSDLANTSEVKELMRHIRGLVSDVRAMDPGNPGWRPATQLAAAVGAYDAVLDRASDEFVSNPPEEFLAVHAVLSRLVIAALESQEREVSDASRRGAYGLACAPEPTPPALRIGEAPPPPIETPVEICVLVNSEFKNVTAIRNPTTGELYAIVDGERRPFREVYPELGSFARTAPWYASGEPIEFMGVPFVPWGPPHPSEVDLAKVGEFRGVDLFASDVKLYSDVDMPPAESALFVPVTTGCVVQEYRAERQVRRTRG